MSTRKSTHIVAKLWLATAIAGVLLPLSVGVAAASTDCVSDEDALCQVVAELTDLHATVDALVPDAGIADSLDVKIDAAAASVLAGRYGSALNVLDAFDHEATAIARENRTYTAISNILKTKHDTVKNSIGNLR